MLLFAVLFFLPAVSAFTQEITLEISSEGIAKVTHNVNLKNESEISVCLISDTQEQLKVFSGNAELEFKLDENCVNAEVLQNIDLLRVEYLTNSLTNKIADEWSMSIDVRDITITSVEVLLPSNTKITNFEPDATVYFQNSSMMVNWEERNFTETEAKLSYTFDIDNVTETSIILLLFAMFVILLIVIAFFVFWKFKGKLLKSGTDFSTGQEELMKTLSEKEKKLIKAVFDEEGLSQKKLLTKCDISKATLSRTLRDLEKKEFLRLVQDGYTNRIYLSEWFRKK